MLCIPRGLPEFGVDCEHVAPGGIRIVEGEVIEVFLYAHGVLRRDGFVLSYVPAHISIGGAVRIHRESGNRLRCSGDEVVFYYFVETVARLGQFLPIFVGVDGASHIIEAKTFFRT